MIARISRNFSFQAAIHYENKYILNLYLIKLYMNVTTDDIREQNIALDRIKYLIEQCFDSCVFVEEIETKSIDLYSKAGIKTCSLPDEPYDQIIAAVLLSKFNTVTEGKLFITEIKIKSNICDEVVFYISHDEDLEFSNKTAWYTENNASIDNIRKSKKDKVVELKKDAIDWVSLNLGWTEKVKSKKDNQIVFVPFEK